MNLVRIIKDRNYQTVAYYYNNDDNKTSLLKDKSYQTLGTYFKEQNLTRDYNGQFIGMGDLLMTLINT